MFYLITLLICSLKWISAFSSIEELTTILDVNDTENIEYNVAAFCKSHNIKASCKSIFDEVIKYMLQNHLGSLTQPVLIDKYKKFSQTLYPPAKGICDKDCVHGVLSVESNAANWDSLLDVRFAILSAHYMEDLSWLREVNSSIPFIIASKTIKDKTLYIEQNVANEVLAYLLYILKYYDRGLPDYTLFLHGHFTDWHQFYPIPFIVDLLNMDILPFKEDGSNGTGYYNVNNIALDQSWRTKYMSGLHRMWTATTGSPSGHEKPSSPSSLSSSLSALPDTLHDRCCAQFIVHKQRILSRPKVLYERLLKYAMEKDELADDGYHSEMSFYMEYIWHYILGKESSSRSGGGVDFYSDNSDDNSDNDDGDGGACDGDNGSNPFCSSNTDRGRYHCDKVGNGANDNDRKQTSALRELFSFSFKDEKKGVSYFL